MMSIPIITSSIETFSFQDKCAISSLRIIQEPRNEVGGVHTADGLPLKITNRYLPAAPKSVAAGLLGHTV